MTSSNAPEVVYLLPYSANDALHGGIIRAREISKKIQGLGATLKIFHLGDMPFKNDAITAGNNLPAALLGDMTLLGRNFHLDEFDFSKTRLLIFEQPWAWEEVKRIANKNPHLILVYSSQNIEWRLKETILRRYIGSKAGAIGAKIRDLEIEICQRVDHVLAVSLSDANWYEVFSKSQVQIIPNGTSYVPNVAKLEDKKHRNYAIVVGSAHPPNIEGCFTFLDDPDLWLPQNTELVVVGTLAQAVQHAWGNLTNRWGEPCVKLLSYVTDEKLSWLISQSNAVLLPISYGGGTNLKTAEALVSGRPIVASTAAFRGYERYAGEDQIKITSDDLTFKTHTISYLLKEVTNQQRIETSKLKWDRTLEPLQEFFKG